MLYQIFLERTGFYDGGTGFAETLRQDVVTSFNARAGVVRTVGGGEDVLPGPGMGGMGIFFLQGVG